ncbi:MAG: FkbM family methyltransferase, partial [Candidatus Limnocylindria bacterium]
LVRFAKTYGDQGELLTRPGSLLEGRMTILHQLRRAALKLGLDVQRAQPFGPGRLLSRRGVDVVLDVGAHRGQYGEQLRSAGYRGRICSFEPLPASYELLARRVSSDRAWEAHNLALGAEDGTAILNVAGNEGASSSILPMLPRHVEAAPEAIYVDAIEVPIRRLDTIWDHIVPPARAPFLKLDVQGFEGVVLDGATDHLDGLIGLQLEISVAAVYAGAPTLPEILKRTQAAGMRLVQVEPGFSDPATEELLQMDGVFMRPAA